MEILPSPYNLNQLTPDVIQRHHLEGLLCHYSPSSCSEEFSARFKKQWIHNSTLLDECRQLGEKALRVGIEGVLLKGIHLLTFLYQDPGLRFMSDIDLLISPDHTTKWEKLLRQNGFELNSTSSFGGRSHKTDWSRTIQNIEVNLELHTDLFFHLHRFDWEKQSSGIEGFQALTVTDLFLHLCGHLVFQHTFLRLNWLYDLYFLYEKEKQNINWVHLYEKSHKAKLFRSVQMVLWVLKNHLQVELGETPSTLFNLPHKQLWQSLLTPEFLLNPNENTSRFLILKHMTKDSLQDAVEYDLLWMRQKFFT